MTEYNYAHFEESAVAGPFVEFRRGVKAGMMAPDAVLLALPERQQVRLSSIWGERHVVMEFGSLT